MRILFLCCMLISIMLHATAQNGEAEATGIKPIDHSKEIVFGQTGMLSGHFKQYSRLINQGILSYFGKINRTGGIKGKLLRLESLDDFGRPEDAEKNIKKLQALGIDTFIGNMGTRNILATLPLIENKEIAVLFPWGGDAALRKPTLTNIINGQGFLQPQTKALADYVVNNLGIKKIALFHADDTFSIQTQQSLVQDLAAYNIAPIQVAEYNRYTLDITTPSNKLIHSDPKAVICISTSLPTVKLVNRFFQLGHFGTIFLGIDSTLFARDVLAAKGVKFYFSSAVPDPRSSHIPLAQDYISDLAALDKNAEPNVLSFSYYLSAAIIVQALQELEEPFTKEKIIAHIEKLRQQDFKGISITFDPKTRHAFGQDISIIKG